MVLEADVLLAVVQRHSGKQLHARWGKVTDLTDNFALANAHGQAPAIEVEKKRNEVAASKHDAVLCDVDVDAFPLAVELSAARQAPTAALADEAVVAREPARHNAHHQATDVVGLALVVDA